MWFVYHFFMVTLCCTNILFFICNWSELRLDVTDVTNILLTIIGFLFAFAGINIYSIFNTNIEAEKERLIEMRETYSRQMDETIGNLMFSANMTKLQLYSQLIFTSLEINSQILEWIQQSTDIIDEIVLLLDKASKSECLEKYNQKKNDVIAVTRSLGYLAKRFVGEMKQKQHSFFYNIDENNATYIQDKIESLIEKLESLSNETVIDDNSLFEKTQKTSCRIWAKLKAVFAKLLFL